MNAPKTDASAIVVPFGKHKGTTVAELLARDPQYAEWLLGQGWLAERFAELHSAIITRGAGTDDTPEHNAIQARFLDATFRTAMILAANPKLIDNLKERTQYWATETERRQMDAARIRLESFRWRLREVRDGSVAWREPSEDEKPQLDLLSGEVSQLQTEISRPRSLFFRTGAEFEQRGVDVVISGHFVLSSDEPYQRADSILSVEIKPTMGDDYPTVMRQMQRLGAGALLLGQYTGTAVPLPSLREMFAANRQRMVTIQDVECESAAARKLIDGASE